MKLLVIGLVTLVLSACGNMNGGMAAFAQGFADGVDQQNRVQQQHINAARQYNPEITRPVSCHQLGTSISCY